MDTREPGQGTSRPPERLVHECHWSLLRQLIETAVAVVVVVEILIAPAVVIAAWRWLL
jgi:hypothetical protein